MDTRNKSDSFRHQKSGEPAIPDEVLDDLSSRFIINIPETERKDLVRVLFQIELAHWFYLDFYCKSGRPFIKSCGFREFAFSLFKHIPFLAPYVNDLNSIIEEWRDYKSSVPTYGAIIMDEDLTHVLLVQSYWSRTSWGFPKGKINKDEPPCHCAIREVFEETGFNIAPNLDPEEFIETTIHDQIVRLYIIPGVNRNTRFHPRTRNEIRAVSWFLLSDLPVSRKDSSYKYKTGLNNNAFFMVMPFLRKLRQWIFQHSHDPLRRIRRNRYKSCGDIESIFEVSNDFVKMRDHNKSAHIFSDQEQENKSDKEITKLDRKISILKRSVNDTSKLEKNEVIKNDANGNPKHIGTKERSPLIGAKFDGDMNFSHSESLSPKVDKSLLNCSTNSPKLNNCSTTNSSQNGFNEFCEGYKHQTLSEKIENDYLRRLSYRSESDKLSDRIRNLQVKAWQNFKFDTNQLFK